MVARAEKLTEQKRVRQAEVGDLYRYKQGQLQWTESQPRALRVAAGPQQHQCCLNWVSWKQTWG